MNVCSRIEYQDIGVNNMNKSIFILSTAMTMSVVALQPAHAEANIRVDVANGGTIYNQGKGDAMACSGCHGPKALGIDNMETPRLANIGQVYLLKQLNDYADGKRKDPGSGAIMTDIARALSLQDRMDVAAYLDTPEYVADSSDLKELAAGGIQVGKPERGKVLMTKGIKGVSPACQDCHGLSGRAQNIPAIHQQKYVYLVNQMKRYRDGIRTNDKKVGKTGIMRGIAVKLSEGNIADIAAYLSTVTDLTP